jgi:hypothetical protein
VGNLRARIEADQARTLEGEFGQPIIFVSPNTGAEFTVQGQIIYYTVERNPETGVQIRVERPIVTVRLSSLSEVPQPGETWAVRIPSGPAPGAAIETYVTEIGTKDGNSFGRISYPLTRTKQS